MDMRPNQAAKVDVARVMRELRDEGAELNLRAYRACLAFLAKVGRGQEALMYLQEMEVRLATSWHPPAWVCGSDTCMFDERGLYFAKGFESVA